MLSTKFKRIYKLEVAKCDLKFNIFLKKIQPVCLHWTGYYCLIQCGQKRFCGPKSIKIERFDNEFRFQLTKDEFNEILKCKNFTSSWCGAKISPHRFELVQIYGYHTRDFNNQVKHNIKRFDEEFRFQLSKDKWSDILRLKKSTANNLSKRRTLPLKYKELFNELLKNNELVIEWLIIQWL